MILKKAGIYNSIRNKKSYYTTLYKNKNTFYVKKNEILFKIRSKPRVKKGGDNNCGLRYDDKTNDALNNFIQVWSDQPANVSWSTNQHGYYINSNRYEPPKHKHDMICTDHLNHIHIYSADIWRDFNGRYNIQISYSQKNKGIPVLLDFNPEKINDPLKVIVGVIGQNKNYNYLGDSYNLEDLFKGAINFFNRLFKEIKKYNDHIERDHHARRFEPYPMPKRRSLSPVRRSPPRNDIGPMRIKHKKDDNIARPVSLISKAAAAKIRKKSPSPPKNHFDLRTLLNKKHGI